MSLTEIIFGGIYGVVVLGYMVIVVRSFFRC